jgi:hypothetical protein
VASRVGKVRLLFLVGSVSLSAVALAADPRAADPAGPNLDQLLKLPSSTEYSAEKRGGATRSEWRHRFHEARASVVAADKALKKAQDELAQVAGTKDEWQFSPPGLPANTGEDSTASFQLRQEVKRQRSEVERSKARLRDLEVEANLDGVPEDWRDPSTEARSGDDSVTDAKPAR